MLAPEITMNYMLGRNQSSMSLPNRYASKGSIRSYRREDRLAVEKIIREAEKELPFSTQLKHRIGRTVRHWLDFGHAQASFFVLTIRNEIAGFVGFTPVEAGHGEICQVQPLYLRSDVRGSGFGQQLLDHTVNRAREIGYRRCYLEISERLNEAIRLIESYGFYKMPSSLLRDGQQDHTIRHYMKYIF